MGSQASRLTYREGQTYVRMGLEEAKEYESLKQAILHRYGLHPEVYRGKFRASRKGPEETFVEWGVRTRRYFERWVGDGKDDAVALSELVITEQLINGCGSELQVWLKDRRPQTVEELTTLADTYRLSRQRSSQGRTSGGVQ